MIEQIRSKQAYILNNNIGVSYNTPIAANINGVTFITSTYYSNTTAHHKTDIIRHFNNYKVVEVKQDTINTLYKLLEVNDHNAAAAIAAAAIKEETLKNEIIKTLKNNQDNGPVINGQIIGVIKHDGEPTKKDYKNGNQDTKYYYRTNFKHVTNIKYETILKSIPKTIYKNGNKYLTHDYKSYIVNIKEV